jgi:Tfp pilus assembly protein PilN
VKRSLGIEIGEGFAAVCEVAIAGDGTPRRQRFARHELSGGQKPAPEELADACVRLTLELGIRERSAVLTLARSLTYAKSVQLPPLQTEDRLRLVALQPDRFFPVSERTLVCDLEPADNGRLPVAHAADAERLEALIEALESRGFRISAVLPSSATLQRAATRGIPTLASANWLLVRPEGGDLTAHAYEAQVLRVSRRLENFAADPVSSCREISRTARRSFGEGVAVQEVRWSGWRDLPAAVREMATSALAIPVHDLPELPVGSEGLAAYGAALAGLEEAPRPDLMPPLVRARRRQQSRWVTAACAALVLLGVLSLLWSLGERQERRLRRLEVAISDATAAASAASDARDRLEELEDRIAAVEDRMGERAAWIRLLNEISTDLPGGAWISSLAVEPGGEVSLSGYAATASSLIPALERTAALGAVELAAPATRAGVQGRDLEAFNIRAILEGSPADSIPDVAGVARDEARR